MPLPLHLDINIKTRDVNYTIYLSLPATKNAHIKKPNIALAGTIKNNHQALIIILILSILEGSGRIELPRVGPQPTGLPLA